MHNVYLGHAVLLGMVLNEGNVLYAVQGPFYARFTFEVNGISVTMIKC